MFPVLIAQLCLILCDPMDWSPPGSSVPPSKNTGVGCHSLLQGISQPRDWTQISCSAGRFFTVWATRKAHFYRWGNKFRVLELELSALSTTPRWSPTRMSISFPCLWMFCPGPVMHNERAWTGGQTYLGLKVGATLIRPVLLADCLTALSFHFTYQVGIKYTF